MVYETRVTHYDSEGFDTKYDAPYIEGYSHAGNSSEELGNEATIGYLMYGELLTMPFFPDGEENDETWPDKIKWAIYRKVN
jgi:hypothetical protein